MKKAIGIIGYGNMGAAIAQRVKAALVYDKDPSKTTQVKDMEVAKDVKDLVSRSDIVILAVKPQDFEGVLAEIKDIKHPGLIISVAAGITTAHIERILGDCEIIRAMPNLAAKIGRGITGLCRGKFAGESNLKVAKDIFSRLGKVLIVEEKLMGAVTAVSGSGPAYVCYFLKKGLEKHRFLAEFRAAGEKVGFNRRDAALLVNTTFSGTSAFLKKTHTSAAGLIKQVASKGGTTEAALRVLEAGGSLREAILAAKRRAEELSK